MKTLNISAQTVNQSTKKAFIPGYQFHIILLAQPKQRYIWCINDFFFFYEQARAGSRNASHCVP